MSQCSETPRKIVPPIWLLLALIAMFLLDRFAAVGVFGGPFVWGLASGFIMTGIALAAVSAGLFNKADTGLVPFSESTAVVTSGPFKFTRNPMYLGMVLVLIGAALAFGSLLPVVVVPIFGWIIQVRFILGEERFMEEVHGEEYLTYKKRVRRWV